MIKFRNATDLTQVVDSTGLSKLAINYILTSSMLPSRVRPNNQDGREEADIHILVFLLTNYNRFYQLPKMFRKFEKITIQRAPLFTFRTDCPLFQISKHFPKLEKLFLKFSILHQSAFMSCESSIPDVISFIPFCRT